MFKALISKFGWVFLVLSIISILFSQITLGPIVDSEIFEVKPQDFISHQTKSFNLAQDGNINFKIKSVLPDTMQSLFEIKIFDSQKNLKYDNSRRFARNLIGICRGSLRGGVGINHHCKTNVAEVSFEDTIKLAKNDYFLSINPKVISTDTYPKEPFKINIEIRSESSDPYKFIFASMIFLLCAIACWSLWVGKERENSNQFETEEEL